MPVLTQIVYLSRNIYFLLGVLREEIGAFKFRDPMVPFSKGFYRLIDDLFHCMSKFAYIIKGMLSIDEYNRLIFPMGFLLFYANDYTSNLSVCMMDTFSPRSPGGESFLYTSKKRAFFCF